MAEDGVGAPNGDIDAAETREWLDSLTAVLQQRGPERASYLLSQLKHTAARNGVEIPFTANTPHINTIPLDRQPPFPGSREIERRIKSLIRWNAMAMVVRANKHEPGIAGTSRRTPRRRRFVRSVLTTFSAGPRRPAAPTSSTSRAMPRPASMPALSSKAASAPPSSKTFAASWRRAAACPRIPTPG